MNDLYVQTDGVRSYAQIHDQIAAGLSQVIGIGATEALGVQNSHGTIAAAVGSALSGALETRHGTMQATAESGATISELLQKAAQMYEQGDRLGAEKLRAAAAALEGQQDRQGVDSGASDAPGGAGVSDTGVSGPGVSGPGVSSGAGNPAGGQMIGQVLGQVGQQVGQLAGSLTAPLMGLAQGLQQVPQQVMQGVQQAVGDAAGSARDTEAEPGAEDESERIREPSDRRSKEPTDPTDRAEPTVGGAASGDSTSGRAPEAPPVAERPRPAPTRPQAD